MDNRGHRLPQPVDGALAFLHPHFDVGLDQDADAVADRARTGPADAESLAGATADAVSGDHVRRAHRDWLAVRDDFGRHPVVVLGEARDLRGEPHVGAAVLSSFPQHRLQ